MPQPAWRMRPCSGIYCERREELVADRGVAGVGRGPGVPLAVVLGVGLPGCTHPPLLVVPRCRDQAQGTCARAPRLEMKEGHLLAEPACHVGAGMRSPARSVTAPSGRCPLPAPLDQQVTGARPEVDQGVNH